MIHKDKLKGKYVTYIDKEASFRTHKVTNIVGRVLTVKDAYGTKRRIKDGMKCRNGNTIKILGRQKKKEIEEIKWK